MSEGLFLNVLVDVNDENGGICLCGSAQHIFYEFDMPRCIDQRITGLRGLQERLRGIDGHVVLAFFLKLVGKVSQFSGLILFSANGFYFSQFIVW